MKKCKECKKEYESNKKTRLFCSKNCKRKSEIRTIKADPVRYKHFKELDRSRSNMYRFGRKDLSEIFNRFNGNCKFCGVKAQVIHHIDGNGDPRDKSILNNDINNLVPLCRACHARLHIEQGDIPLKNH